ncbi:DUF5684 domain-containing protein [Flavobacterium sp. DG1-102-2]|uniref:DUF5684 domain-containing protein n=1 Tax=Flavobacterium sp. DG1-102-2 TaxID=3081663 RepID=UPI00294A489F|nr:DUF5684 domain-containing protein [Flavobacterium sp. DG1-102-2]MDV6167739.1 DUF5684 domain-containing protein [Flavobacterium sp. DG1-102-2]
MDRIGFVEIFLMMFLVTLPFIILITVSMWKLYTKANKPGWAVIVPIYSTLVLLEIIRKPWWWLLLMMIPFAGIVWAIWAVNLFVKSFGKDEGFTIGVLFLPYIFYPILAFSKSTQYIYNNTNEMDYIGKENY